jgi:GTPase
MTKRRHSTATARVPGGLQGQPIVAIVGRPNVGKSTIFNRLVREKRAIVFDEPGVTRDRHYADTTAFGRPYTLVDTGGFDPESDDPMQQGIAAHVREAIDEADVIVFLTDASGDIHPADEAAVALLRRTTKPVIYAANKADSPKVDADAAELYKLGIKKLFLISALHGRGIGELEAEIVGSLPPAFEGEAVVDSVPRIAIIGKPNAGKSSLMNRILGTDRMLVDDKPGTTRDAIELLVEYNDKPYVMADTAGMRKKGRVTKEASVVETVSVLQSVRAIERSQVVVLLCDAKEGVAEQDAKILGLAEDRGKALIIALNKCDLLTPKEQDEAEEKARGKLTFAPYAPIIRLSAKTGRGIAGLFKMLDDVHASYTQRVSSGVLNRFFEQVLDLRPPPTSGGKAPRLYYITQAQVAPPTFVAITNAPESIHFSYQRFVQNQLRKHFGFDGVPVRVFYRQKRQTTREERNLTRAAEETELDLEGTLTPEVIDLDAQVPVRKDAKVHDEVAEDVLAKKARAPVARTIATRSGPRRGSRAVIAAKGRSRARER